MKLFDEEGNQVLVVQNNNNNSDVRSDIFWLAILVIINLGIVGYNLYLTIQITKYIKEFENVLIKISQLF